MPGTQGSESFDSEKNGRGFIFLHLKSEKSTVFEHKRGVPGKGKTENFGCFMAFSRSLNSPNGEFKTKKAVGLTGVFFITFAHPYSRLVLRSLYFMLKSADLFAKICQSEFSGKYDTFCNTQKRNITILSYCRIFRKLVR